jgi:tRNA(fMet)-specific endonuclease VapC
MDKSLLDTDILSEVIKGVDQIVARNSNAYRLQFGRHTIATITVVEVVKGFQKKAPDRVDELVNRLANEEILPLGLEAAVLAGRIFADLERVGQTIGRADPIIAGVAISHGLVLVTGNTNHFERIKALGYDLRLENWRENQKDVDSA